MDHLQNHPLPTPPASAASPALSTASAATRISALPTPRSHRLQPGSQKEIALINYLDDRILKITRRYAKKFSHEGGLEKDDTPGYTTYDEFVADVDPLVDVVWISGTPTIQIPYLLSLAGLACSYLQAFRFSTSVFSLTSKIDQGFATLLQPTENGATMSYNVSMTEKVRIKSLIEETRVAAVNAASGSGHDARIIHDVSETETEDDDKDTEEDDDQPQNMSISLGLSRIYKRTLEILGDSLVTEIVPQAQSNG
ncbi:uncharacterized protein Z520_02049 [Fonsecaea multimorphosa CBS 102226]|uniref:Uncharacterized protein n=1 Tax=Fonsecaea multimorphosa CBS 102226 TaxID=1442371 RepID=A0A0D2HJ76_9EURO|nr:uncharacterized protein Z520_02049 [Fonsecaea multimorphosa CBS 102226]KIY01911.1 hypothetical protein Z520_02049 [Fonsecaea multimorphosa CBS 102226]OAL29594.1 hypothetical protein AYO22_02008 [Fonsecaea multimorphosa]